VWEEIEVLGAPTRGGCEPTMFVPGTTVHLEVAAGVLPEYAFEIADIWIVRVRLTGFSDTNDPSLDLPDEPMSAAAYVGVILDPRTGADSDTKIRLEFVGDVLDHCFVQTKL